jgi:basic amino acid/polyamine antiporter, APA family
MAAHQEEAPLLLRKIGLYAATCITVGNIVGSGIFRSPHSVALELSSVGLMLMVWILGGVLSLCGSLVLAELAVAHPRTGGLYVYIRENFGDRWAFTFGWASLWVVKPTVIASIVSVFALYFCQAVGLPDTAQLATGIAAIVVLTFVNGLGVRQGAWTQTIFTTMKILGIALLCFAAFVLPHGTPSSAAAAPGAAKPLLAALVAAMIPVLFAYDGWTDSTYVAGEIKEPRRTLPIAILAGTGIVIVVYVVTNLAYFAVLDPAEVAAHEAVGLETVRRITGAWGGTALAVLVSVSTFGTTNGAILTGPRVTLAQAADGLLPKALAHIDPKRAVPDRALWVQAVLSCIWLAAASGFEDVSGWFVTTSWLFYGLVTAALFVQRRREKREGRVLSEYRTPLYPLTPIVFVIVTVAIIASDLSTTGWRAAAGVLIAALGIPIYSLWKSLRSR